MTSHCYTKWNDQETVLIPGKYGIPSERLPLQSIWIFKWLNCLMKMSWKHIKKQQVFYSNGLSVEEALREKRTITLNGNVMPSSTAGAGALPSRCCSWGPSRLLSSDTSLPAHIWAATMAFWVVECCKLSFLPGIHFIKTGGNWKNMWNLTIKHRRGQKWDLLIIRYLLKLVTVHCIYYGFTVCIRVATV